MTCGAAAAALAAAAAGIHWQRGVRQDSKICAAAVPQPPLVVASRYCRLSQPEGPRVHNPTAVRLLPGETKTLQLSFPGVRPQQAPGCECCWTGHVIYCVPVARTNLFWAGGMRRAAGSKDGGGCDGSAVGCIAEGVVSASGVGKNADDVMVRWLEAKECNAMH